MPRALVLLACLLVCGCSGGADSEGDGATSAEAASVPCSARPDRAAQRDSTQILVVIGSDSDEPAGPLAIVRRDGREFRRLGLSALEARWSPDGRRIALIAADNFTLQSSVWVMNADGRGGRQLVSAWAGYSRQLEWSPDGTRILYDRRAFLWSIRPDGREDRRVARNAADAEWSPDGRSIAFVRRDDVYVARQDGSDVARVAKDGVSPKWAAGGEVLVFVGVGGRMPGLYAVAVAGSEPHRVVPAESGLALADVSPDGCSVLVGDASGLVAVSLENGTLRRLTGNAGDTGGEWSADGRRIAFLRADDLWVVSADGGDETLVRRAPGSSAFAQATWRP